MTYIDPLAFSKFIRNDLPKGKMTEIEKTLLENGSANATFIALIDAYESRNDVNDIIGEDDEDTNIWSEAEKIFDTECKNLQGYYSNEINEQIHQKMTNVKISTEDFAKVASRYQALDSAYDTTKSLRENLLAAYKTAYPSASEEDASATVDKLIKGCDELTTKYHQALSEGFNAETEIGNITKDMDVAERYQFLVNALSAVEALNIASFPSQTSIKEAIQAAVKEFEESTPNPTEADCEAIQKLLAEAISNNTLVLAGSEKVQDLLKSAKETAKVVDFASAEYDDARMKAEMALAMWLEYQAGNLPSVEAGASPESIAIGAATAVEEAKVMNDVAAGKTTADVAVKCLKILGGIALCLLLGYVALTCTTFLASTLAWGLSSLFGTSIIGCIATIALTIPTVLAFAKGAVDVGAEVLDMAGDAFDLVVEKLRESVFPKIKEVATRFINWIKSKLGQDQGSSSSAAVAIV